MAYDRYRAGQLALALMYLTLHNGVRAWKGYSWEILDHLFQQGMITDPRSKAKSVMLMEEGLARSRALFEEYLASPATRSLSGADIERKIPTARRTKPTPSTLSELQQAEAARLLEPFCRPSPDPAVRATTLLTFARTQRHRFRNRQHRLQITREMPTGIEQTRTIDLHSRSAVFEVFDLRQSLL